MDHCPDPFRSELAAVAERIGAFIRTDPFPESVRPPSLCEAVRDYPCRGGKRIRPALVLWSCELFGGNAEAALPAAASVEVYHNWTLVHDDIIDCDDLRRGLPTCHHALSRHGRETLSLSDVKAAKFGIDLAILAGDIQQAWAIDLLLRSRDSGVSISVVHAMLRRMQSMNRELIGGEALDVILAQRALPDADEKELIAIHAGKTGALLRFCVECGAMIGLDTDDGNDPRIRRIGEFAVAAGIAFQLRDDYLGIFGDRETFGKPIGADLSERKTTPLLAYAWKQLPPDGKRELESLLGKPSYSETEIARVRDLLRTGGAVAYVEQKMAEFARRSLDRLNECPDMPARKRLEKTLAYFMGRDL